MRRYGSRAPAACLPPAGLPHDDCCLGSWRPRLQGSLAAALALPGAEEAAAHAPIVTAIEMV